MWKAVLFLSTVLAISEVLTNPIEDGEGEYNSALKRDTFRASPRHFHHLHKLLHLHKKYPHFFHSSGLKFGGSLTESNAASLAFGSDKGKKFLPGSSSFTTSQSATFGVDGKGNYHDHHGFLGSVATGSAISEGISAGIVGEAGDHSKHDSHASFSKGAAIAVSSSGNIPDIREYVDKFGSHNYISKGVTIAHSSSVGVDDQARH